VSTVTGTVDTRPIVMFFVVRVVSIFSSNAVLADVFGAGLWRDAWFGILLLIGTCFFFGVITI